MTHSETLLTASTVLEIRKKMPGCRFFKSRATKSVNLASLKNA